VAYFTSKLVYQYFLGGTCSEEQLTSDRVSNTSSQEKDQLTSTFGGN
jgi:hypothetical protein